MKDTAMGWTDKQKEAIDDRGNSLLVSAAAGSGKTAVLIERIVGILLSEKDASLDRMLIVTFTRAAASEMREKLRNKLGDALEDKSYEKVKDKIRKQLSIIGRSDICTFDSFAQKTVRNYYHVIGVDPGLKVCDNYRSSILKDEAMDEMFSELYEKNDPAFIDFLDHYSGSRTDQGARDLIASLYSYTDTLPDPEAFLDDPEFRADDLLELGCGFALSALERSMGYIELLRKLFEEQGMPKCLKFIKEKWSELDSLKSALEAGNKEQAMELIFSYSFGRMPSGSGEEKDKKKAVKDLVDAYWTDGAKEELDGFRESFAGISVERLEDEKTRLAEYISELCLLTKDFRRRYAEKKKREGIMDFSDGEHFAFRILQNEEVKAECRSRYLYVFVDEYQDTNPVQESLIEAVAGEGRLFTVGDVKQSIYKFRHAEPELFMARAKDYRADPGKGKVIDLNNNFRSKPLIRDFVNRLFENLMTVESCDMEYGPNEALNEGLPYAGPAECLYEPELYLVDTQGSDDADDIIADLKNTELEAMNAARVIKEYADGKHNISYRDEDKKNMTRPLQFKDMVILLRSAKNRAEVYYDILTKEGIGVYLERNEGYFDTPEIQVFVNLLRIIDNPRQDVPLISVLYFPSFGFSVEDLAGIRMEGRAYGKEKRSFYDDFILVSGGSSPLSSKCRTVLEKIRQWRVKASAMPLADFLWELLAESGIMTFASGLSSGEQRTANLSALVDRASDFENTSSGGLFGFISYIDVISDDKSKVNTGQSSVSSEEENVVRIMTVHKSKGLQFPFVFFASCGGNLWSGRKHPNAVFHRHYGASMALSNPERHSSVKPVSFKLIEAKQKKEELAEEIRILYVAATRAEDVFIMSANVKDVPAMKDKKDIFRVKGAGCSNFAQMALPAFEDSKVKCVVRSEFSGDELGAAASARESLAEELKKGFDVDKDKLSLTKEEIEKRLNTDYSPKVSETEKKKFTVSELAAKQREKEGKGYYEREKAFPVPAFLAGKVKLSAAAAGTAYHKIMEHIPFNKDAENPAYVSTFMEELLAKGILSEDEFNAVKPERIAAFFASDLGDRVCSAKRLKKETPFVIKHEYEGRSVLVQGTIDCWFEDGEKLILLDYKSNYVDLKDKESEVERLKEEYRPQLALYSEALESILGRAPDASYLYLFSAGEYVSLGD